MQYLPFFVIVVLVGITLKIGKIILKKILGFTRLGKMFTPRPHPIMIHLHREVEELKRTTLQITKDWAEMNQLIDGVREQQNHFVLDLETDLNSMRDVLGESLASRLHEQRLHAELRSEVLGRTVGAMVKEMAVMRETMSRKAKALATRKSLSVEEWSQTEGRKKQRDGKGSVLSDHETIKAVMKAIKQALVEFLKEAQRNLSRERAEMMDSVRVIFTQLGDDREDIKASIAGAFNASSQQTVRCFEQLGLFGREAVGCIVSMSDHSDQTTASRYQDLGSKLRDVLRSIRVVDINVGSVKDTLDNIDSQFDDIYRKLEIGQRANSDQCSDIADRMSAATRDFEDKTYGLDAKHRQVAEIIGRVADNLNRFRNQPVDKAELQAMVNVCGKRVQVVTEILEQFASRVERPMQQVVCQMKFLTDVIGTRLKEEGHLPSIESGAGENIEALTKALMEQPFQKETDQKGMFGVENSKTTSGVSTNTKAIHQG